MLQRIQQRWIVRLAAGSFFVSYTVFCLMLLNYAVGWWLRNYGDALDRTHFVLTPDTQLGWRHKPNLDTNFEDHPFQTNAFGFRDPQMLWSVEQVQNTKRVLLLGPSSAVGWGVNEGDSYARVAENILRSQRQLLRGADFQILNASQIGFSTWQGLQLIKTEPIASVRVDYVVLAYGVNDLDRYRFYFPQPRPDREVLVPEKLKASYAEEALVNRFHLTWLLWRKLSGLIATYRCATNSQPRSAVPPLRVEKNDLFANLIALKEWTESRGAKLFLISTPHRFSRINVASGENADALYRQGAAMANQGHCRESQKIFERARSLEVDRLSRDADELNAGLRLWAMSHNVPLIDAAEELIEQATEPKQNLFIDPVHPSKWGHARIAATLARRIMEEEIQ